MSTLLCTELLTSLSHEIRLSNSSRMHLAGIYPYLLKVGNPAGTFTISLIQGSTTLMSNTFIASDINSDAYAHTFFPVIPTNPVQLEAGLYTVKLTASDYLFSASNYIAWIQQFEDIQNPMEYTPASSTQNPLTLRIKTYKEGIQ